LKIRSGLLALTLALSAGSLRAEGVSIRVKPEMFRCSDGDIAAVCRSAAGCLTEGWKKQPDAKVLVIKGDGGPFVAFRKNDRGESVVRLDSDDNLWSQVAYQFAHELCHVLCKCEDDYRGNLWFEETLAETASMYCMRRMGEQWRTKAPYPNWKSYAPSLEGYVRNVIRGRELYPELVKLGMPAFYRKHKQRIESEPCDRAINGAMAIVLLNLFESDPKQWEAIRWLNSSPSPKGESFRQYLKKWHDASPEAHRGFIAGVADLYGVGW
jgi:hypothetical protein